VLLIVLCTITILSTKTPCLALCDRCQPLSYRQSPPARQRQSQHEQRRWKGKCQALLMLLCTITIISTQLLVYLFAQVASPSPFASPFPIGHLSPNTNPLPSLLFDTTAAVTNQFGALSSTHGIQPKSSTDGVQSKQSIPLSFTFREASFHDNKLNTNLIGGAKLADDNPGTKPKSSTEGVQSNTFTPTLFLGASSTDGNHTNACPFDATGYYA